MNIVNNAQGNDSKGIPCVGCIILPILFIHRIIRGKYDKIKLYTKLSTLSTENYVNQAVMNRKNKNKGFVNKF
jgi:hypothetical protein